MSELQFEDAIKLLRDADSSWDSDVEIYNRELNLSETPFALKKRNENGCRFPCLFTGDVGKKEFIVSISLNPSFSSCTSYEHQSSESLQAWAQFSRSRFSQYIKRDEALHPVFHHLLRATINEFKDKPRDEKCAALQNNIINIDWCPYYSKNFKPISSAVKSTDVHEIMLKWNERTKQILDLLKPKYVFVHGKSLEPWWNFLDLKNTKCLIDFDNKKVFHCRLRYGTIGKTSAFYCEYFLGAFVRHWKYSGLDIIWKTIALRNSK